MSDDDGPLLVTADSVDPDYARFTVTGDVVQDGPVPHRVVSAGFDGTDARFNVYLPAGDGWEHRFFHSVYPLTDEHATDRAVAFAAASGAYVVQSNDPGGHRIDAASAKAAREIAADHYGTTGRIHGYVYGASGGGYQTIGALENTEGVWDGGVPMVIGVPTSIPGNFFVRVFARFALGEHAERIAAAVRPGGSGDPYAELDPEAAAALREVSAMGVPLRAWEDPDYLFGGDDDDRLLGFAPVVESMDPSYVDDFWTLDGYLGTASTPLGERVRAERTPQNERELAVMTYYRHQLSRRGGYPPHDQFRDADGRPLHPQRPVEIGPIIAGRVCGTGAHPTHTGALRGRAILLQNLLDPDAFPADADWYRSQVAAAVGAELDDRFRVWFTDHADHHPGPPDERRRHRLVSYTGVLEQALRDLAAWVEQGVDPPLSTGYRVVDGQVQVARKASERRGVQPVVELTADGGALARAAVGEPVQLEATIASPPGGGLIVSAEWHTGDGRVDEVDLEPTAETLVLRREVRYDDAGTYFPRLRVTAQRPEAIGTPFAELANLARARVVVTAD